MSTVSNDVQTSSAMYPVGAAVAAGAVAGGAGGYFLTKAIDKEKGVPTDSFLSYATAEGKLSEEAKKALDAAVSEKVNPVKDAFTNLDGIKEGSAFKELAEGEKNAIKGALEKAGYTTEQAAEEIAKIKDAESLKALAQSAETKAANIAKEGYIKPLIKEGKFVAGETATAGEKAVVESLKSSASKFKWWAAAKWAAIGAAVLGIVTYFMSGSKKNVD